MESVNFKGAQLSTVSVNDNANGKREGFKNIRTAAEIQTWMLSYLAELLKIAPNEIDITIPFDYYGLDSAGAVGMSGDLVGMSGDLEEWLGSEFEPNLLYDYPTIEALAQYLAEKF